MLLFYILTWLKTTIKENIITKLQKLYSLPKNLRVDNKLSVLFLKKPLHTGNLWPAHKIFIERPVIASFVCIFLRQRSIGVIDSSSSIVLVGMDLWFLISVIRNLFVHFLVALYDFLVDFVTTYYASIF